MAIDAGIYGQIQAPTPPNPLADFAQIQQIQGYQNQNKLAALGFQDRERALADDASQREAVKGFSADSTANYNRLLQIGNLKAAQEYQKQVGEQGKTRAEAAKMGVETGSKAFDLYKAQLGTAQDPNQAAALVTAAYHDPVVGPLMQRFGTLEDGIGRLRQALAEPGGFEKWKAGAAIGIEKLAELAKVQNVNLGGSMQTQMVQPATGQTQVIGSAPITQSADNMANNATSRANNASSVGATIRGQNLTDARSRESNAASVSKPFEVTGPDGNPVLVQQDKQGNITPVSGYAPKGGTSKPLPSPVVKQLTEARDNAATIDRLAAGFKPDFANKGVLGVGADLSLASKGTFGLDGDAVEWWKNYRKGAELVERHALFGAALTPGEQASWNSADIGPGMDNKTIARNLATRSALSRKMFENTTADLIDAGHSEKRITAIAGRNGTSAAAPAADGWSVKVRK